MLTILSPSKTQNFEVKVPAGTTQPEFLKDAEILMNELRQLSRPDIGDLMKLSEKLASLNYERFQQFDTPFTPQNAKPAVLAFRGDVYDGLDADTLSDADLDFAQQHLRLLSGLYGLLRPLDLIQPYRLEMKTKLANPKGKDLYTFWGTKLAEKINQETDLLVNLASNEYFKALPKKALQAHVITPQFKEYREGKFKVIALYAKKARGAMARFIIENRIKQPENLRDFRWDGYMFHEELSNERAGDFVFTRGQG